MFGLIKKMFIGLLTGLVNGCNHTKCASLINKKCQIQPTLINLHPNEYSQEFQYYLFAVKLDRCVGSCNALNDSSNKVCIRNKTEDLNLSVFNIITGINELKTLTKHISCECKCKLDGTKCNSNQWWNKDKCRCECKKQHICEKRICWNPSTCICENGNLANIMNDTAVICDEVIDADAKLNPKDDVETKTIPTNFNGKKATCKTQNLHILLAFLLITIALLIVASIYCCLINNRYRKISDIEQNKTFITISRHKINKSLLII